MKRKPDDQFGPWNPGLRSQMPREYLQLSTMYRPENVSTSLEEAEELSDFCGLAAHVLVEMRAERLAVHELLIRITADFSVPDGSSYEDLGINFREVASNILENYIAPKHEHLSKLFADLRYEASSKITAALEIDMFGASEQSSVQEASWSFLSLIGLGGVSTTREAVRETAAERESRVLSQWREHLSTSDDPMDAACYGSLINIVTAISGKRGQLVGDKELIASLATTLVCNSYGSDVIGKAIDPLMRQAVANEGYRLLPPQKEPVVLNVKGASAAGKSTMRPLQRSLVETLDIAWSDFALISPDIWRKFLLDYDSLGATYKYAGTMSGHELEIIDHKLDRYMANKAASGKMSHLLIDRFRFDSFVAETEGNESSKLLTRFGDLVYMFFMITPPDATVERAWKRGLKFGRYKAVDDLLDHNVEAYTGMPQLFFTWALRTNKRVHYEFLDNSVKEGRKPRTVAFGWNGEMNILDINCLVDVDRFRKINVNANGPQEVYEGIDMAPEHNLEFIAQCARLIPVVNFVDAGSGQIMGRLEQGSWTWHDQKQFMRAVPDLEFYAGLVSIGSNDCAALDNAAQKPPELQIDKAHILGAWDSTNDA